MIKKVILFGSIPLATKILKFLISHPCIDVVGVVCEKKSRNFCYHYFKEQCVYDYVLNKDIAILTLKDILTKFKKRELFVGISARNADILNNEILSRFRKGVINCHGGLLPQYRGLNSANFAVLHNQKKFAGTIHYMTEKIDEGPIVARQKFIVKEDDTAYDIFCKVQKALYKLIEENIDKVLKNKDTAIPQEFFIKRGEKIGYYCKNELEKYKRVDNNTPIEDIYRVARAFEFPGHERAYLEYKGKKIYLRTTNLS